MLFLFCCATDVFPLLSTKPIIWTELTFHLAPTGLTPDQILWISNSPAPDQIDALVVNFHALFNSRRELKFELEQIQEFRSGMYRLLVDIVRGVKLTTQTLEENKHPLFPIYERVLAYRDEQIRRLSGREEQRA